MDFAIRPLADSDIAAVVAFSLEAWAPVFASFEEQMGPDVFALVYPDWRADQGAAVEDVCRSAQTNVWVAVADEKPLGFVATRLGEEGDARIGEIEMVAVDPAYQRRGAAGALLQHAVDELRAEGVPLLVIATGGDPGHAPARALYERFGFYPFPLVRYYRMV